MTKGLSVLIVLVLFLLPLSARAQPADVPFFLPSSRISTIYPMPGVVYFYDQYGNSVIFYQQWSGRVWYSARDSSGRIVQQGYRSDPPPTFDPREMPPLNREAPDLDVR